MAVYRVDSAYVDERGLLVNQGEHVELTEHDAELGLRAGHLAPVDRPRPGPAGPETPPRRRSRGGT